MMPQFRVETTPHFDRLFRKLTRAHQELPAHLVSVRDILQTDPYNQSGRHAIKKLVNVRSSEGQYRLRLGIRWGAYQSLSLGCLNLATNSWLIWIIHLQALVWLR
jgi:hypothetical protein